MPYSDNKSLPANIRNVLPAAAQTMYRKAFNSAIEQGLSEDSARRIAWAQVKKYFKKNKDTGKWTKKANIEVVTSEIDMLIKREKMAIKLEQILTGEGYAEERH